MSGRQPGRREASFTAVPREAMSLMMISMKPYHDCMFLFDESSYSIANNDRWRLREGLAPLRGPGSAARVCTAPQTVRSIVYRMNSFACSRPSAPFARACPGIRATPRSSSPCDHPTAHSELPGRGAAGLRVDPGHRVRGVEGRPPWQRALVDVEERVVPRRAGALALLVVRMLGAYVEGGGGDGLRDEREAGVARASRGRSVSDTAPGVGAPARADGRSRTPRSPSTAWTARWCPRRTAAR